LKAKGTDLIWQFTCYYPDQVAEDAKHGLKIKALETRRTMICHQSKLKKG